ncbi:MAG: phage major capsid protein [Ilumatobacteraceae bacterium]|nr:phage major capsid protein [Ilumatobacteraceae bacterium]MBP6728118.1 phage major capsid protein [Microthrixaceae bacterium]
MSEVLEFPELKETNGKIAERQAKLKTIFDEAGPTLDMAQVKSIDGDSDAKVKAIGALNAELADLTAERDKQMVVIKGARNAYDPDLSNDRAERGDGGRGPARKSIGEQFAASAVRTGGMGTKAELAGDLKTLMSRSAGWAPESLRESGYQAAASAPLMVLDLIPTIPTQFAAVKYMEQTTRTNNAAERAEGSIYGEAAFALTERSVTVETVGVWLPYTDEQMEDEAEAAAMIDAELPMMLWQRIDSQVLVGDGNTPNILGVNNKPSIQTQAKGADTTMDAVHKAITKVRVTGRAFPNAVVFHPNDWQDIRLTRTADGIYILGAPTEAGPDRLFGLRVVQSDNQTENTAVAGDFANYAQIRVKRGVEVEKTNAHDTYFINGKQAIRAGVRMCTVWRRAAAFATVTGI